MDIQNAHYSDAENTRVRVEFVGGGSADWPRVGTYHAEYLDQFLTDNELEDFPAAPVPAVTNGEINAARDRRIDAGITFNGVLFQTRPEDRENIQGAYSRAQSAILIDGAQPGDFTWHGGPSDFEWIAANDSRVKMDAQTMMAFGEAVLDHKSAHIFAANAIKAMDPVPSDFDEIVALWP